MELTKGRRWGILGLNLILLVIQAVLSKLIELVAVVLPEYVGLAVYGIAELLLIVFTLIPPAVGYYYLRAEKEGVDGNDIAQVFD